MTGESRKVLLQSMTTLCSTALGLVGALTWNDAIKEIIKKFSGSAEGMMPKVIYAVIATLLAIIIVYFMARATMKASAETTKQQISEK